ncbi:hypothetical protein TNCV_1254571 [Trichonephila clavipes]|nr:hypothetical protein TNCV_1254571 [Trichonephila clavipes]
MEVTRVEQRAYIKIAVLRERNAMEGHSELVEALGELCPTIPFSSTVDRKVSITGPNPGDRNGVQMNSCGAPKSHNDRRFFEISMQGARRGITATQLENELALRCF